MTRFTNKTPVNKDKTVSSTTSVMNKNNMAGFKLNLTSENLINGIVISEVLQKPKSFRKRPRR